MIIFGSTARGTATEMSDIDVMIIVNDACKKPDGQLKSAIRAETYLLELEDNVIFDLKVIRKQELQGIHGHTPFMENVLREGITV